MKLVLCVLLTLGCLTTPTPAQFNRRQVQQSCVTPERYAGSCVGYRSCPEAANVFQLTDRRTAQNYLSALQRSCGSRTVNGDALVCCTRPATQPVTESPTRPTRPTPPTPTSAPTTVRQNCITPENYYGSCVALSYCPQAANVFQLTDRLTAQSYVIALQRSCGTRSVNGDPLVCCTRPVTNVVTERPPFSTTEGPFVTPQVDPPTTTSRNPFLQPTTRQTTPAPTTVTPRTEAPPTSSQITQPRGAACRFPPGKVGECVEITQCQPVLNELRVRQTDAEYAKEIRASNLVCGSVGQQVCCPTGQVATQPTTRVVNSRDVPRRLPTVEEGCGSTPKAAAFKKVVGGEPAKQGSWPWIALIGYDDASGSPFKCGGTLITARHVVTAAHCIREDLTFVRLGEHDLRTDTEAQHVDIKVVKTSVYPQYVRRIGRGDIALLYLERNVEFTDTILPICMPSSPSLRAKSYVGTNPFVVGWGKTQEGGNSAEVLQQLMIPVRDNEECKVSYAKVNRYLDESQFDKAVLCAGFLTGGKDTCQGDSGGPLMTSEVVNNQMRFYLIGVVSYGVGCARPEIPGVYTSTQYFMDWILEQVMNTQ